MVLPRPRILRASPDGQKQLEPCRLHGDFPKLEVLFRVARNKDYSILGSTLGSILGSPYFGKQPHVEAYMKRYIGTCRGMERKAEKHHGQRVISRGYRELRGFRV